jgi:recombination associated protein RdgC
MSLQSGSATFSRFTVEPPAGDSRRWLARGLQRGRFEPLDLQRGEEDRSAGFVEREDVDATGFHPGAVMVGEWAVFAWRVDAVKVKAAAVKVELARWDAARASQRGRPPSKAERAAARDTIRRELRLRTPVGSRTYELCWNLKSHELLAWVVSRKVVDELAAAFEVALEATLTPCSAAALVARGGGSLDGLRPTEALVGKPGAAEVAS